MTIEKKLLQKMQAMTLKDWIRNKVIRGRLKVEKPVVHEIGKK